VNIIAMDSADWKSEPALKKMESMLNVHKDIKGVFCANDMMAFGAIRAIDSVGKTGEIVVAAYDNLKAAQEQIRAGRLHATIEQHPDRMGAMGVEYAVKAIKGEEIPAEIPVETDLVIADNLKEFAK
jgi:ribose transport system substrate-binding protein